MAEIQVKTQTPPKRCETCHKSDFFDPQANYCLRCSEITKNIITQTKSAKQLQQNISIHPALNKYYIASLLYAFLYLLLVAIVMPLIIGGFLVYTEVTGVVFGVVLFAIIVSSPFVFVLFSSLRNIFNSRAKHKRLSWVYENIKPKEMLLYIRQGLSTSPRYIIELVSISKGDEPRIRLCNIPLANALKLTKMPKTRLITEPIPVKVYLDPDPEGGAVICTDTDIWVYLPGIASN